MAKKKESKRKPTFYIGNRGPFLDAVAKKRARKSGGRPSRSAVVCEAIDLLMEREPELAAARKTK